MLKNKSKKNQNIQFLRGIAILLTLLTHLRVIHNFNFINEHITPAFETGLGVDLFFILSGFLMGASYITKTPSCEPQSIFLFYKKRIQRLFIPTIFWATFILVLSPIWLHLGWFNFNDTLGIFFSASMFLGNVYNSLHENIFGYFWSLGVEFQFYLIFPFLMLFKKYYWIAALLILLLLTVANPINAKLLWQFRWDSLFIGVLIWAVFSHEKWQFLHHEVNNISKLGRAFFVSFFIVAASCLNKVIGGYPYLSYTLVGFILAFPFFIMVVSVDKVFSFLSSLIEYIGEISFSLYLSHLPIWGILLFILNKFSLTIPPVVKVVSFVLIWFIVAHLSYLFIEKKRINHAAKIKLNVYQKYVKLDCERYKPR